MKVGDRSYIVCGKETQMVHGGNCGYYGLGLNADVRSLTRISLARAARARPTVSPPRALVGNWTNFVTLSPRLSSTTLTYIFTQFHSTTLSFPIHVYIYIYIVDLHYAAISATRSLTARPSHPPEKFCALDRRYCVL